MKKRLFLILLILLSNAMQACAQTQRYEFANLEPATILPALFGGKYAENRVIWQPDARFSTKLNNPPDEDFECETNISQHKRHFFRKSYPLDSLKMDMDTIEYVFFETTTNEVPNPVFWTWDVTYIGLAKFIKNGKKWKLYAFEPNFSSGFRDRGMPNFEIISWDSMGYEHFIIEKMAIDGHPNRDEYNQKFYYTRPYDADFTQAFMAYSENNQLYVSEEKDRYYNNINIEIQAQKQNIILHKTGTDKVHNKTKGIFETIKLDEHKVYRLDKTHHVFIEVVE